MIICFKKQSHLEYAWPSQNAITNQTKMLLATCIKAWQYKINQLHIIKQIKHRQRPIIALVWMWSLILIQLSIKIWHKCRHSQNVPNTKISHCESPWINKLYSYNTRKLLKFSFACQISMCSLFCSLIKLWHHSVTGKYTYM